MSDIIKLFQDMTAERDTLRGAIKKAIMRLGAPTMEYAPKIAVREYKDSIEEASRILLKALNGGTNE